MADSYGPYETEHTYVRPDGAAGSFCDLGMHPVYPSDVAIHLRTSTTGGPAPTTAPPAGPDPSLDKQAVHVASQPGDPITVALTIANHGDTEAADPVIIDVVPSEVLSPSFVSTLDLVSVGALSHTWNVESLVPGRIGVITIYGRVDPELAVPTAFVNVATIWDSTDEGTGNNRAVARVVVGGHSQYLPMVVTYWSLRTPPTDNK